MANTGEILSHRYNLERQTHSLSVFPTINITQTGRTIYEVIDGQQRLRAVFDYIEDRFHLSKTKKQAFPGNKYSDLDPDQQKQILNYDLLVEELSGYSDKDIRDMFIRMNRYVVKLSPQEMRHAREKGAFKDFVDKLGKMDFWKKENVFSALQIKRMRAIEFAAELTILLVEGPQDKKSAIDLYYGLYKGKFPAAKLVETRLRSYLNWIKDALPNLRKQRYRKPVDLYALVSALDQESLHGKKLSKINRKLAGQKLNKFETRTKMKEPTSDAARYLLAASRQTDNIGPRNTRIEILVNLIKNL